MLTCIFTPTSCSHCRLCCHFRRQSAWETPFLEPQLAEQLAERGIPLCTRADGSQSIALSFHTDSPEESCNCPLLDPAKGCTLPREERPFECRVWPLRLLRDEHDRLCIGCYSDCPALSDATTHEALVSLATGELLPRMLDYARRFPQSIRPLDAGYTIIWRNSEKA